MTSITVSGLRQSRVVASGQRYLPVLTTMGLLVALFGFGAQRYYGFAEGQLVLNLFINKSFLLVIAVGMTFVILTGGIDLSVGAVVALTTMVSAVLLEKAHWPVYLVLPIVLGIGLLLGTAMGAIIHFFDIQPFIVTLAGMFFARGVSYLISDQAISITDSSIRSMAMKRFTVGPDLQISFAAVVALAVVAIGIYVLHYTRLGRNVYALGGNEQSAHLMGLPAGRTKVAVYSISGFCSALGGILWMLYSTNGDSTHAIGLELTAIAAVVVGGTLLTGGSGFVVGTVLGVLVLGLIEVIIGYESLSPWWAKIATGVLVLLFIVLQRVIGSRKA